MKPCATCERQNPDEARFCLQCGQPFVGAAADRPSSSPVSEPAPAIAHHGPTPDAPVAPPSIWEKPTPAEEEALWRAFIGPHADRYLEQFKKFTRGGSPAFALTWHWPAFLVDPFLWFLYRKMYLYAAVYAVGPVVSAYLTGDLTVGVVWRIMAGASANYIYYWHVRDKLADLRSKGGLDPARQAAMIRDLGGVQVYVVWLGVALHLFLLALLIAAALQGPPDGGPPLRNLPRLVPGRELS